MKSLSRTFGRRKKKLQSLHRDQVHVEQRKQLSSIDPEDLLLFPVRGQFDVTLQSQFLMETVDSVAPMTSK